MVTSKTTAVLKSALNSVRQSGIPSQLTSLSQSSNRAR